MDGNGSTVRMVLGDPRPAPTISSLATGSETSVATRTGSERATGRGQFPRWASRPLAQPSTESRPTPKFSRASPSTGHTDSSGIRSIHEGCQIRAMHRIVESRRFCRVEVVASCLRESPCTVGSTRAKRRLEKAREAVKAAQEAVGTSGRFAEVGGSQGRCCPISSKFTFGQQTLLRRCISCEPPCKF